MIERRVFAVTKCPFCQKEFDCRSVTKFEFNKIGSPFVICKWCQNEFIHPGNFEWTSLKANERRTKILLRMILILYVFGALAYLRFTGYLDDLPAVLNILIALVVLAFGFGIAIIHFVRIKNSLNRLSQSDYRNKLRQYNYSLTSECDLKTWGIIGLVFIVIAFLSLPIQYLPFGNRTTFIIIDLFFQIHFYMATFSIGCGLFIVEATKNQFELDKAIDQQLTNPIPVGKVSKRTVVRYKY
jgi:hypothetical protein